MSKHKNTVHVKDGKDHKEDTKKETVHLQDDAGPVSSGGASISEADNLKELLKRKAAEFENYKRRTESQLSDTAKFASERIITELLPVYDDLQRSIESINKGETKDFETLKTGVILIYEKLKGILDKEGLSEINTVGQSFDVDLSNALMLVPRDDVEPNTVIDSFEKGYKLKGKVIRHERVMVSAEPKITSGNDKTENN